MTESGARKDKRGCDRATGRAPTRRPSTTLPASGGPREGTRERARTYFRPDARGPPLIAPLSLRAIEPLVAAGHRFTHLERVTFPAHGARGALLKAHVVDYYARMADVILPHLADRPLVFRRYTDGIDGDFFYTKDWDRETVPAHVRLLRVWSESRGATMQYATARSQEDLAWIAQTAAIEIHPWLSRARDAAACASGDGMRSPACGLDHPDLLAFDVDPYVRAKTTGVKGREAGGEPGLAAEDWAAGVEAAFELRDLLRSLGLAPFVKTSGKRALHLHVPVAPEAPYEVVRAVARQIATHLARKRPSFYTLSYDLRERKGRVFLDYNQNARGKTLAAPYSLRPTREATVSMPLAWDELADADPAAFTLLTVPDLVRERGDAWRGIERAQRSLRAIVDAR